MKNQQGRMAAKGKKQYAQLLSLAAHRIMAAKGKEQRRDNGCQGKRAVCAAFAAHRIKPFLSL